MLAGLLVEAASTRFLGWSGSEADSIDTATRKKAVGIKSILKRHQSN